MSLFLGKIHYWLYHKIQKYEQIELEIIKWANREALPVGNWQQDIIQRFGAPTENKPLEEVIDTSNIHGWLQEKIKSAELRQAYIVTQLLNMKEDALNTLKEIETCLGTEAAREVNELVYTPEEVFEMLNNYLLEGMPCDHVSEPLENSEEQFVWKTTRCLHTPYWEQVNGDVKNYYTLRDCWITAFVQTIGNYTYTRHGLIHTIHKL